METILNDRTALINAIDDVIGPDPWDENAWLQLPAQIANGILAKNAEMALAKIRSEPADLHRGASEAQRLTVDEIRPRLTARRVKMLSRLEYDGPQTCDWLEAKYLLAHQSTSATLHWLERHGLVERDRTVKRKTRRGGTANPYRLTPTGRELLRDGTV